MPIVCCKDLNIIRDQQVLLTSTRHTSRPYRENQFSFPDDKRRQRLATFLEGYGRRVQESVFEFFLLLQEMQTLQLKATRQVKATEDNVRLYWVPADAVPRTLTIGSNQPQPPPSVYIV